LNILRSSISKSKNIYLM